MNYIIPEAVLRPAILFIDSDDPCGIQVEGTNWEPPAEDEMVGEFKFYRIFHAFGHGKEFTKEEYNKISDKEDTMLHELINE